MVINIEVKNRVATYRSLGSDPVCGSNNDTVKFHFDEEWQSVGVKTARFVWGNRYFDQEFEGDSCKAPMFVNLTRVYVGVYAGEPVEEEPAWATTKAEVPYRLSVRCGYHPANPESGNGYTNEAKGYAMEAQAAAELAIAAAAEGESVVEEVRTMMGSVQDQIEEAYGLEEYGRLELRMNVHERLNDEGNYVEKLNFGEDYVDLQNGSVLLCLEGDVSRPIRHSMCNTVVNLMQCPVTRIILKHSDPNCVLRYPTVYDGRCAGEFWNAVDYSSVDGTCRLYDTEWAKDGVRLVYNDNPNAANLYYGPNAIFLQFPEAAQKAIQQANLTSGDPSHYLICTIIGYQ